ncbi:unnamed protein product [Dovyalis caffra]|uniref:Uncharacterized protein n=1 Tax=Dovyalis caffra TaxID=77055 RepID=A0AAV1SQR2_9ROSI|nr:unnamed protein product [Dovyalis caffra]
MIVGRLNDVDNTANEWRRNEEQSSRVVIFHELDYNQAQCAWFIRDRRGWRRYVRRLDYHEAKETGVKPCARKSTKKFKSQVSSQDTNVIA